MKILRLRVGWDCNSHVTQRQRELLEEFAGEESVEPYRAAAEGSG